MPVNVLNAVTQPRRGSSKAAIAAVLLLLAQGVVFGALAWLSSAEYPDFWISGGFALCCIVSAVALAKRRVAFPLVFQGCLMLFVGWIVIEGISYFTNDRHECVWNFMPIMSMLIAVLLMGVSALFLVQTKSALKWFSGTAIAQRSGLAEKIKRGVWTVLIADVLLLAFGACLDLDTAIWSKGDLPDVIFMCEDEDEFLDDKFVITDFFGIPLGEKVNVRIWAKMYGIERVEEPRCSRTFLSEDSVAFGVPGPWEVTEQINTTNGCVEVVSASRAPIGYEAVSNMFDTVGQRFWSAFDINCQLADDGSPCVGKWSDGIQTVEIVSDVQSLRISIRQE
jgi:hypothetical protein